MTQCFVVVLDSAGVPNMDPGVENGIFEVESGRFQNKLFDSI
jgi:hypothetical protein